MPLTLLDTVRSAVVSRCLVPEGAAVLAAVSGGADSVALLRALLTLAPEFRWRVCAAHFNHHMRDAADSDEEFVRTLCHTLGVELQAGAARGLTPGASEEQARRERMLFLEASALRAGCHLAATGHNADDRAETLLLNIARGSGAGGLRSIRWKSPLAADAQGANGVWVVRPLLEVSRQDIRTWLDSLGQHWVEDTSNISARYARNRVRLSVIPTLEREISPSARQALWRLAETSADEDALLEEEACKLFERIRRPLVADRLLDNLLRRDPPGLLVLESKGLRDAHPALARRAVRMGLQKLLGHLRDVTLGMCEEARAAARQRCPRTDLGLGTYVRSDQQLVTLGLQEPPAEPFSAALPVPGRADLPVQGLVAEARRRTKEPRGVLSVRIEAPGGPLQVRSWQAGDRMRPEGVGGTKKLQDIFVDAKIPAPLRHRIPLFCHGDSILWVPGVAVAAGIRREEGGVMLSISRTNPAP